MKKLLRGIGIGLLAIAVVLGLMSGFARFQDGPLAMFPGGPLTAGELADPSWQDARFLAEVGQIELQLVEPPRSRTTWVVVHEGQAYIPCGLPTYAWLKQWPHQAARDGRAVVRVDGVRHHRQMVRVTDEAVLVHLREELSAKYATPPEYSEGADAVWFFRLDPRPTS